MSLLKRTIIFYLIEMYSVNVSLKTQIKQEIRKVKKKKVSSFYYSLPCLTVVAMVML